MVSDWNGRVAVLAGGRLQFGVRQGGTEMERTGPGSSVPPVAVDEAGRTFLYECDGVDAVIRTELDGALLQLPDRELRLRQVPTASGARYEGAGLLFWSKGDEAMLEVAGEPRRQCVANPRRAPWAEAAMRGVDFRAIGNEPGWHLEVDDGKRIQLVTDYGERTIYTPAPAPRFEAGIVHYDIDTEAHRLKVEIEPVACQDSMSGEAFEARVSVTLDGDRYLGCGRYLATTR
ncbi:MliC family protein [Marinobacterium aestuariivivens]|uniref:MliC family protein n=1 Tax=Marinobacterium aestuariivivens TaxID=1698799 RepID=A0ABW2A1M8_9GAMM